MTSTVVSFTRDDVVLCEPQPGGYTIHAFASIDQYRQWRALQILPPHMITRNLAHGRQWDFVDHRAEEISSPVQSYSLTDADFFRA